MLRKDTVDTQSAAPNTAKPEVVAQNEAASQTLESGNGPSLNIEANVIVVQSNKSAQLRVEIQEWLAANRGLNNQEYPFSNRVMAIFDSRFEEMGASDLAEKQRFFNQATLLFAAIKRCEELKMWLDHCYELSSVETDRLFINLLKQKCDEACFALESNFSVPMSELEDIIATASRLEKLNKILYQKVEEQERNINGVQSSLYADFYNAGIDMFHAGSWPIIFYRNQLKRVLRI